MRLTDITEQGGVGVVAANKKQAKDPRYSTSMTGDVRPGETAKQAAKFGNKLNKQGMPPLLHEEELSEKALAKKDLVGDPAKGDVERKQPRLKAFVEKIRLNGEFTTVDGKTVTIKNDPKLISQIESGDIPALLPTADGGSVKLNQLEKTKEFGGEESGKRLKAEQDEIASLNDQIESLKAGAAYIMLTVGDQTVKAAGVINTPGTPKSDFEIVDETGKSVAWISHKDGSPADPKKFGQWAGLSSFADHPEVKAFVESVRKRYPEGLPKGATAMARTISDDDLQKRGMYGKDFGKALGINNVTTILQGPVKIVKQGDGHKLTALAEFVNGEEVPESYTPIFVARYISDRGDFGSPHTRMSIYPMFGRKTDFATDEDPAEPITQEPEVVRRMTRPDWYKQYKDKAEPAKKQDRKKRA